jgi:hypothetical protein
MLVVKYVRLPLLAWILILPVAIHLVAGVKITEFIVPFDLKPSISPCCDCVVGCCGGCSAGKRPGIADCAADVEKVEGGDADAGDVLEKVEGGDV